MTAPVKGFGWRPLSNDPAISLAGLGEDLAFQILNELIPEARTIAFLADAGFPNVGETPTGPGSNITGAASLNVKLGPKRPELLHELVPRRDHHRDAARPAC